MKVSEEDINYGLVQLITRCRQLTQKARQKELKQYGISVRQSGILTIIARLGKRASPGRIARELFLEPHSVSETLSRMERQGLVKKVKDLDRKNLIRLEITEKGYKLYRKSTRRESFNDIMSVLTEREKIELWAVLSRIRASAMEHIGISNKDVYPPSDYAELSSNRSDAHAYDMD